MQLNVNGIGLPVAFISYVRQKCRCTVREGRKIVVRSIGRIGKRSRYGKGNVIEEVS